MGKMMTLNIMRHTFKEWTLPDEVEVTYRKGRFSEITVSYGSSRRGGWPQTTYAEEQVFVAALRALVAVGEEAKFQEVIRDILTGEYPWDLQQYVINSLFELHFPNELTIPEL